MLKMNFEISAYYYLLEVDDNNHNNHNKYFLNGYKLLFSNY